MTTDPIPDLAVLDAWVDGEAVSRDAVAELLRTEEGRVYALDIMRLRRALQEDAPVHVTQAPSRWRPVAAAAAILLTTAGGYVAGQYTNRAGSPPVEIVNPASTAAAPAPAPTRVIQFEVGVDWNEASGGN
jgi:hypothetical protein